MADFESLGAELDIQEEEKVRKLQQAVPRAWLGLDGLTGPQLIGLISFPAETLKNTRDQRKFP